jgi:D-alanyl-D-alanine carboxypeptidase
VLQPVNRRRRRRRRSRRGPLATAVGLLVVAALCSAWLLIGRHAAASSAAPKETAKPPVRKAAQLKPAKPARPAVPLPLLYGTGAGHVFSPPLAGKAAIVVDATTGKVLYADHPYERLPIASLTKIMTALLVLQHLKLGDIVHVGVAPTRVPEDREGLRDHDAVPVRTMLYGLLLYSGNDDALALGQAVGGSRSAFLFMMNHEAKVLGLHDSHFASTSGVVDVDNYSSAWDLAALTRYVRNHYAVFRAVVRTKVKHVSWAAPTYSKIYVNKNHFLWLYPGANGVKTGWTTLAGPCVVETATRHGTTLLAVVINSPDEYGDAARLMDYGFGLPGE